LTDQLGFSLRSFPAPIAPPTSVVSPENALATVVGGPAFPPRNACDVDTNESANVNSPTARPLVT
jgi:hypothetical protein